MEYPGLELENFDKAHVWRKYIFFLIKKYLRNEFLEVGAGIGSFTRNYKNKFTNITLSEFDSDNLKQLKQKFMHYKNIKISGDLIQNINNKFNTIIYLNVLEHIKDDIKEVNDALKKLNTGGYMVILVPAHQKLYSKFDKAIGHHKRYAIDFFQKNKFDNTDLIKLYYADCMGYFLYFINKFFFKEEVYPSKLKIFIWDKIFVPVSIFLDFFLRYKYGKNIICVLKKK
jgi:ubiquinone/menaquinone biosynthesis C-methylase UbiE